MKKRSGFIPKNYNLYFVPDLEKFKYKCREVIDFEFSGEDYEVLLDCVGLDINSCSVLMGEDEVDVDFSINEDVLCVKLPKTLDRGNYKLAVEFGGKINNFLAGWYRSEYKVEEQVKYIATTQFEPADARRVFPCIDDPMQKSTFDISMEIDRGLSAISNMLPVEERSIGNNKTLVIFERTPVMSSYLLYLGVGDFEFLETKYRDVIIRGVTTKGKSKYTEFALDCAKKFLGYFEDYFGYDYPLPKVDLIAVANFAAGAMENWGAITFRENALLVLPNQTSIVSKKRTAEVIAHELAHQWFGNLVTMKWWDDLWLNESFATFMANKAVHHFWPEWDVWTEYVTDTVFEGMALDSLKSSHPIQVKVESLEQINELFDEIAYDKGGGILRMLEGYLGESVFRDSLRAYIEKHKYKNAEGRDLWDMMDKISGKKASKIMESFIVQTGFPSLSVNMEEDALLIRQERFLYKDIDSEGEWHVPIVVQDDRGVTRHVLEGKAQGFIFKHAPGFVNVNYKYSGFYHTIYSDEVFERLVESMERLSVVDRIGLLDDFYKTVLSGERNADDFVSLIDRFFVKENNPFVLTYILEKLYKVFLLMERDQVKMLVIYFGELALRAVDFYPKKNEDSSDVTLRNLALFVLATFDHKETLEFGRGEFEKFLSDENSLHQDLRAIVYRLAVYYSDEYYEKIVELYRKSNTVEEKVKFLSAMASTKNKKLLIRTMDFALTDEVSFSNIIYIFISAGKNLHAKDLLVEWFIENWDILVKNGGGLADLLMRRILKSFVPVFGVGRKKEIKEFFKDVRNEKLERTFDQVLEEIEVYSRFVKENK